jgi:hypothetical protein
MRTACERGHTEHATRTVTIRLGGPTGFADYAPIPWRFVRTFEMQVYERGDDCETAEAYCPACDAVSEMLTVHGAWEPQETILALTVMESGPRDSWVVDLGAHVGWYSLLAATCGMSASAWDADAESLGLLELSADANGWTIDTRVDLIGPETQAFGTTTPIRLAKIDIEGAEVDAVRMLWPCIEADIVDHILMEVSPCLAPGYPELALRIADAGYQAYAFPPKRHPPYLLDDPEQGMWRLYPGEGSPDVSLGEYVESCGQANLWFRREGASW